MGSLQEKSLFRLWFVRSVMSIILDHISYTYSTGTAYQIRALDDVSLKIDDGEFIGIIGLKHVSVISVFDHIRNRACFCGNNHAAG